MVKKKQTRRMASYPLEFRLRVLREVVEERTAVTEVARIFGVSDRAGASARRRWAGPRG